MLNKNRHWALAQFFLILILSQSCAYKLGYGGRAMPAGITHLAVPTFTNETDYVGVEADLTRSMIMYIERSKLAEVAEKAMSQATLKGTIQRINVTGQAPVLGRPDMPLGTTLWSQYVLEMTVQVTLVRNSDQVKLWEGSFTRSTTYQAPLLLREAINSSNPIYNLSARRKNLAAMADILVAEAYDRMTEGF